MAGPQREMNLGVLSAFAYSMLSLLYTLAMSLCVRACALFRRLRDMVGPLAQRSWQWLSETVGPPVQRSWQWLDARFTEQYERLETYALNFLEAAMVCFLLWNLVGFTLHFVFFFGRLLNARANVALDPEGVLYVVEQLPFCAPLTDAYNETSNEIMLTKAMAMAMDWTPPERWPWYTCPWCLVVIAWPESAWDALCDVDFTVWILAVMVAIVAFYAMFIWSVYCLVKVYRDWRGVAGPVDLAAPNVSDVVSDVPAGPAPVATGRARDKSPSRFRRAPSPAVVPGVKQRCKLCQWVNGVAVQCSKAPGTANSKVVHITRKGWLGPA